MEFDKLVKRLSPDCRDLFENAVARASSRSHFAVEIEHWLQQALERPDGSVVRIIRHFDVVPEALDTAVVARLESMRSGNCGFPRIAPNVARLLCEAWTLASSRFGCVEIRSAHILLALISNDVLRQAAARISEDLVRLPPDGVVDIFADWLQGRRTPDPEPGRAHDSDTPALDRFTIDLTASARAGHIDPVLGRGREVRQIIDILCRRRQNNPVLTGEAGVGKTAVVEGLARRIAEGDAPDSLQLVHLHNLDLGLLQAGAGVRGEFENRLKDVINEVQRAPHPIIVFIDEAHMLIGGGQAGPGDAANLLKPALARGELRTIAATTWAEYKRYIESDAALSRRFQVVTVDEPDEDAATSMLRGLVDTLEAHHNITILEEAVHAAVRLSKRYISGRQLPDKCVSLLDTACARVALTQTTTPAQIEDGHRAIASVEAELQRLAAEQSTGEDHAERIDALRQHLDSRQVQCSRLGTRWQEARRILADIRSCRGDLHAASTPDRQQDEEEISRQKLRLSQLRCRLADVQEEATLVREHVDAQSVAEVIADWTGIPTGRMHTDEIASTLGLQDALSTRVIGQDHALNAIARTLRTARLKLGDPTRPLGVFLLVGPSGVGKTETALALAEQLYGSDEALTVINLSEFKEEHKVSLLMGSPPGYIGYGQGGVLTEAVRRRPYSVVLLDEVEKAHPGVQDVFYQIFDKGTLRDGEGRDIDFRNTVVILTSNCASKQIERLAADPGHRADTAAVTDAIGPTLRKTFKPAFLGRLAVIPYYPLDERRLMDITALQIDAIRKRLLAHYGADLVCGEGLHDRIAARCQTSDAGARQVGLMLNDGLLPALSEAILRHLAAERTVGRVTADVSEDGAFHVSIEERPSSGNTEAERAGGQADTA